MRSPQDIFNAINQQVGQLLPESAQGIAKQAQNDIQEAVKTVLAANLSKLDLVTREEFEIQREVLLKTREKVETLERLVAELESQLKK